MKATKQQVENAIIVLAERIGNGQGYKELLESGQRLPELVKQITYHLFVSDFNDYFEDEDDVFYAYKVVKEYAVELDKFGDVQFGVAFNGKSYRN